MGLIGITEKGSGLALDTVEVGEGEGDGRKATGRMWVKKLETLDVARGKARIEAIPTKRKREASKSLKERVGARLNTFDLLQFILKAAAEDHYA